MEDLFTLHIMGEIRLTLIAWLMYVMVSISMDFIHMFQHCSILILWDAMAQGLIPLFINNVQEIQGYVM